MIFHGKVTCSAVRPSLWLVRWLGTCYRTVFMVLYVPLSVSGVTENFSCLGPLAYKAQ